VLLAAVVRVSMLIEERRRWVTVKAGVGVVVESGMGRARKVGRLDIAAQKIERLASRGRSRAIVLRYFASVPAATSSEKPVVVVVVASKQHN